MVSRPNPPKQADDGCLKMLQFNSTIPVSFFQELFFIFSFFRYIFSFPVGILRMSEKFFQKRKIVLDFFAFGAIIPMLLVTQCQAAHK